MSETRKAPKPKEIAKIEKVVNKTTASVQAEIQTAFDHDAKGRGVSYESPKERDRAVKHMEGRIRTMGIDAGVLAEMNKNPEALRESHPNFVKEFADNLKTQQEYQAELKKDNRPFAGIERWVAKKADNLKDPLARQVVEGFIGDIAKRPYKEALQDAKNYADAETYINKLTREGRFISDKAKQSLEEYQFAEGAVTVMQREMWKSIEPRLAELTGEGMRPEEKHALLEKLAPEAGKVMELQRHSMRKLGQLAEKMPKTESGKKLKGAIDAHMAGEKKQQLGVKTELTPAAELLGNENIYKAMGDLVEKAGIDPAYDSKKYIKLMAEKFGVTMQLDDKNELVYGMEKTGSLLKAYMQAKDLYEASKKAFDANVEATKKDPDGVLATWAMGVKLADAEAAYKLAQDGAMAMAISIHDQQEKQKVFDKSVLGKTIKGVVETKTLVETWIKNIPGNVQKTKERAAVGTRATIQRFADNRWPKPVEKNDVPETAVQEMPVAPAAPEASVAPIEKTEDVEEDVTLQTLQQDFDKVRNDLKLSGYKDAAAAHVRAKEIYDSLIALPTNESRADLQFRLKNWMKWVEGGAKIMTPAATEPVVVSEPVEPTPVKKPVVVEPVVAPVVEPEIAVRTLDRALEESSQSRWQEQYDAQNKPKDVEPAAAKTAVSAATPTDTPIVITPIPQTQVGQSQPMGQILDAGNGKRDVVPAYVAPAVADADNFIAQQQADALRRNERREQRRNGRKKNGNS